MSKDNYNLSRVPETELQAELQRREDTKERAEKIRKQRVHDWVTANIERLLELAPGHDRTSCSDEHPGNSGRAQCERCVLLRIKEHPTEVVGYSFELVIAVEEDEIE
jgi:hypothetical protein